MNCPLQLVPRWLRQREAVILYGSCVALHHLPSIMAGKIPANEDTIPLLATVTAKLESAG